MPGTAAVLRSELAHRLDEARARTDRFFGLIAESALYERAIPERHRLVFYLGHLEAFDWNLLGRLVSGRPSFHPAFDQLFAFGIDPVDGQLPSDVPADWPALSEVRAYRDQVRARVDECLAQADPADDRPFQIAIEHRLMHAETLAYMLPHLPLECFTPSARVRPDRQPGPLEPGYGRTGGPGAVRRIAIPAGRATLGMPREGAGFGWDNELGESVVEVPAFTIDARNVTNREYLSFVRAGGYDDPRLWTAEDLAWKNAHGVTHPVLWRRRADGWWQRASFVELPLPLDWPVQVSFAEARAYARWKGRRLPTEAELQRATYGSRAGGERPYAWGEAAPDALRHGNFDFLRWDPAPVGGYPEGDSAFGVADLTGNGWEWTSTVFEPLPGFVRDPLYPGYSEPFFDGKHHVIHGASAQTDRVFLRRSFRNWFQPHYPYVFAAFRCVDHAETLEADMVHTLLELGALSDLAQDVRAGLTRPGQKELPSKYFYDDVGSALFEAICVLPEYGLTRADARLLRESADEIVARLPAGTIVAELGSGSGKKTRYVLEALALRQPVLYHPIDISGAALAQSERELGLIDRVSILGFEAEYLDGLAAVAKRREPGQRLLVLFLGSTIGNFDRPAGEAFLERVRRELQPGDRLLLSTDLVKPEPVLVAAYDDASGVTAAFNKNLLHRINRELDGTFDLKRWRHRAVWNSPERRIEMHLQSMEEQTVHVRKARLAVRFKEGETIWTESSHKYTVDEVAALAARTGYACEAQWVDHEWPFAQSLLVVR